RCLAAAEIAPSFRMALSNAILPGPMWSPLVRWIRMESRYLSWSKLDTRRQAIHHESDQIKQPMETGRQKNRNWIPAAPSTTAKMYGATVCESHRKPTLVPMRPPATAAIAYSHVCAVGTCPAYMTPRSPRTEFAKLKGAESAAVCFGDAHCKAI